jgi:lipoprotein-releasing system ATP-binding protein
MKQSFDITINNLYKQFTHKNSVTVLKGITYLFCQEKSYAIMGASGTGKSTLMHLLAGLDSPTEGTVTLGFEAIAKYSAQERAQQLAFVVQSPTLIKELSVVENIALAGVLASQSWDKSLKEAYSLLSKVGLPGLSQYKVGQLSGGQKQRVALARALMNKPKFLLTDELTGNLDHQTSLAIMNFVLDLKKEWGFGLIISTHNYEIAALMDKQLVLKDGFLIEQN